VNKEILKQEDSYVCTLIINRPERKNALNAAALTQLGDALNDLNRQEKVRVVVIRGAGGESFCAGADLTASGSKEKRQAIEALQYCLDSLINFPLPVISMIYGYTIGAGLDIAVISDFRFAADNARFEANLVKIGRVYYYTAINRLISLIGVGPAKEMLLSGKNIDAGRAKEIGLANQIFSHQELHRAVYSLAKEIAEENSPFAVRYTKLMIKKLFEDQKLSPVIEAELKEMVEKVNRSDDAVEGQKAFLEKRKPCFSGK